VLPQGKLFLTNKRLLLLSCGTVNHASVTPLAVDEPVSGEKANDAPAPFPPAQPPVASWFPSKKFDLSYVAGNSIAYKFVSCLHTYHQWAASNAFDLTPRCLQPLGPARERARHGASDGCGC
jgi:hypothetical protein